MGRRYTPGRRKGHGGFAWAVALVCLLVGVGAGGAGLAWFVQSRPSLDAATLCPDTGPIRVEVVLLDLTDPLSEVQARRLRGVIEARVNALPAGTLIALAALGVDDAGTPFLRCKPLSGEEANALYQNPAMLEERFRGAFVEPLDHLLHAAMESKIHNESPILETLQDILSHVPTGLTDTRVLLVSDLLQNSGALSVYKGESWTDFTAAGHAQRMSGALTGAKVDIIRLPRPEARREIHRAAENFWVRYLDAQGLIAPPSVTVLGDL